MAQQIEYEDVYDEEEEAFIDEMIRNNTFQFSAEGDLQPNSDNEQNKYPQRNNGNYIDDDYDQKQNMDENENDNYDTPQPAQSNVSGASSIDDDDNDDDESDDSLSEMEQAIKANNISNNKQIKSLKYKITNLKHYGYLSTQYKPNDIEKLTDFRIGQHNQLNKLINSCTLTYIYNELEDKDAYPRWINYKYNCYNTAYMLMLSVIIMILVTIHTSFTS